MRLTYFIILLLLTGASCKKQELNIVPFNVLNAAEKQHSDTTHRAATIEYYLAYNYADTKEMKTAIIDFVDHHKSKEYSSIADYSIVIYKVSEQTNLKGKPDESSLIDRYTAQEDLIAQFRWTKGKFVSSAWFKDGNYIVEPGNNITIKDNHKH